MNVIVTSRAPISRRLRYGRALTAVVLLSVGFGAAASADSGQMNATVAITRAQATIDLVSKENPAATHEQTFVDAQKKLADANIAADRHDSQKAVWLANESELLTNTTAGAAKLAELERTRSQMTHVVDVLESELKK